MYLNKSNITKTLLLSCCTFIFFKNINAQNQDYTNNKIDYQIKIERTTEAIQLDGQLDEAVWKSADKASDFWVKIPTVKEGADPQTEVQLTYNDKFIYIAITCFDQGKHVIQTLKRDQDYWDSDAIGVLIDPIGQGANGFMFGVSALGVQMEGLAFQGGDGGDLDRNWDNKWFSASQNYEDRWTVEMAIPFKTLRYEADQATWGINFVRNHIKGNEYHTWTPVPQQFQGIDLNYLGGLVWDTAPKKIKNNATLIPYITGGINHNMEDNKKAKGTFNGGLDAKISVTSSLNLDLTVNPDFSQIEVDQQVTNLTRFSIFLPEKRTFFLENADIFSGFGLPSINPFFSRKIGLNANRETVPILFGARLTGNLNAKTRIGVMNMQTKADDTQLGQNYFATTAHRRVGKRSIIKGLFTNRQAYTDGKFSKQDYNRNAVIETQLVSKDGKWQSWGGYQHSFKSGIEDKNTVIGLGGGFFGEQFNAFTDFTRVGENYYADLGFVNRVETFYRDTTIRSGFFQNFTQVEYFIFPENDEVINQHFFGWENLLVYFPDGTLSERFMQLRYFMNLKNRSRLRFRLENSKNNLLDELTFTGMDNVAAGIYNNYTFGIQFVSDERKTFNYEVNFRQGGFYHGTLSTYELNLNYRHQPWGNFSVALQKNDIRFPDFEPIELIDLNTRIEINFSKSIFWTTFTQYNFQNNAFNINSRLQYRFSPMSDFFIVYTDNYNVTEQQNLGFLESIQAKNRALVFKLNYWFSL